MLTIAQLEAKQTVYKLHPEFWRRYKALMEFARTQGVHLGVGTGWRVQPNPPPPGFASPGNSNHEGFPADGKSGGAVAIDTVCNVSWPWMERNLQGVRIAIVQRAVVQRIQGVRTSRGTSSPTRSRRAAMRRSEPWKLATFKLPTAPPATVPPKPPTTTPPASNWAVTVCNNCPTLIKHNQGIAVKRMQHFLAFAGQMDPTNMSNFDGVFGSGTEGALNRFLATGGKPQNGTCDDMVWNWFMATGDGVPYLVKGNTGGDVTRMQRCSRPTARWTRPTSPTSTASSAPVRSRH